jgi:hypothetical protein
MYVGSMAVLKFLNFNISIQEKKNCYPKLPQSQIAPPSLSLMQIFNTNLSNVQVTSTKTYLGGENKLNLHMTITLASIAQFQHFHLTELWMNHLTEPWI